jgi:hypothetical protein
MNTIPDPEIFRENVRIKLAILMKIENIDDISMICGNIEKGVFNYTIEESTKKNVIK